MSKRPKLDSLEATAVPTPTVAQFEIALRQQIEQNKTEHDIRAFYFTWTQDELKTYGNFLKLKDGYKERMAVDKNALHLACEYGFVQLAAELIDTDTKEREQGKGGAVTRLVDTVSEENKTPLDYALDYALEFDDFGVAALLIEKGANVNNRSPTGAVLRYLTSSSVAQPPLTSLCWAEHITPAIRKTAEFLVVNGADLELHKEIFSYFATPLGALVLLSDTNDPVADINRLLLFDYLLKNGADMYTKMKDEETVMHLACRLGKINFANVLLERTFDLTTKTRNGKTPLESAIEGRSASSIMIAIALVGKGAPIDDRIRAALARKEAKAAPNPKVKGLLKQLRAAIDLRPGAGEAEEPHP